MVVIHAFLSSNILCYCIGKQVFLNSPSVVDTKSGEKMFVKVYCQKHIHLTHWHLAIFGKTAN